MQEFEIQLGRASQGKSSRPILYIGGQPERVDKARELTAKEDILVVKSDRDLIDKLTSRTGENIGLLLMGDVAYDIPLLLEECAVLASQEDRVEVIMIEDAHRIEKEAFAAIIAGLHRISQRNLPLVFIGLAEASVRKRAAEARDYSERLFNFVTIGPRSTDHMVPGGPGA